MLAPNLPTTAIDLLDSLELSGEEDLDSMITNWIMWDKNEATKKQVVDAIHEKDWEALRVRLCNVVNFATAGMRSGMRAGFDSINDVVTIQVAQGLSKYLQDVYPSVQKRESMGVVVGFDGRYNGRRFAQLITTVLLNSNFRVYLFNRMCPSPFVAFGVVYLKCLAGIMVTGSHNPKTDNGFKVYWSNGSPLLTPHDKNLQNTMLKNLEPLPSSWDISIIDDHPLHIDPFRDVYPAYYEAMKTLIPYTYLETNECSQLRFVYTPLHGVGFHYVREAFYQARLKPVIPVTSQKDPDPEFPTVGMPSPLDCKGALNLAIKKAEEEHCTIILANDGDGDRLAVAELDPKGRWKVFNGNELGALLGWWSLENYRTRTPMPNERNCVMIASIVSSKILAAMARVEGFTFIETLVGYKWMASKALELQGLGRTVLFAFEQPIGYMFSLNVPDKDGISTACQVATMACYLRSTRNMTLIEKLREIYDTYGYHATRFGYANYEDATVISDIFDRLRRFDGLLGTYPQCILNGEFVVQSVRDLSVGIDTSYPDRKPRLPSSQNRLSMTFTFTNGMTMTFRTSSIEPKVKFYAELFGVPEQKDWDEINDTLKRMSDAIVHEFIRPVEHGFMFT